MKFGGTSVQDAEAFARVASIVAGERENSPVVVTSAMAKVTDALLNAFETAKSGEIENAILSLEPHFERHKAVSLELTNEGQQKLFQVELDFAEKELGDLLMRVSRRSSAAFDAQRRDCFLWRTAFVAASHRSFQSERFECAADGFAPFDRHR